MIVVADNPANAMQRVGVDDVDLGARLEALQVAFVAAHLEDNSMPCRAILTAMRIDLRTRAEATACPYPADVILDIPRPPLGPRQIADLSAKVLAVAAKAKDAPIEVFCAKGKRAALATAILEQAGYDAVNLGAARCKPVLGGGRHVRR
jgi:rhodanese-related sulfurtransferase